MCLICRLKTVFKYLCWPRINIVKDFNEPGRKTSNKYHFLIFAHCILHYTRNSPVRKIWDLRGKWKEDFHNCEIILGCSDLYWFQTSLYERKNRSHSKISFIWLRKKYAIFNDKWLYNMKGLLHHAASIIRNYCPKVEYFQLKSKRWLQICIEKQTKLICQYVNMQVEAFPWHVHVIVESVRLWVASTKTISLTSDLRASNQTICYMNLVACYIYANCKMQCRVGNFIELEPPHGDVVISNATLHGKLRIRKNRKDLVRPSSTCFVTAFLTLASMHKHGQVKKELWMHNWDMEVHE